MTDMPGWRRVYNAVEPLRSSDRVCTRHAVGLMYKCGRSRVVSQGASTMERLG
jgi:hypothetical protein